MIKYLNKLLSVAVLCIVVFWPLAIGHTQNAAPEEVRKAQGLYQAKDYDGAIKVLEDFFQHNPSATLGWVLLGQCYRERGDLDKSLAAFLKAAQHPLTRPTALFNAAIIQARKKNRDGAFELLQQLRATGNFDMDQVRDSKELTALRDDPRFAKLRPRPEDFANPFVEKVKVIHEWVGENKGDQFSWIARSVGDVDGDGVKDLVTSAPTYGANGQAAGPGRVYVYSGRSGKLLWAHTGQANESLGIKVEKAGDVNGDGIPDVIAGAPGTERAYVYSGRDGNVLLTLSSKEGGESFGLGVAAVGDQNGDGFADVLVGAPGNNAAGQGAGRAYVFSGKDGALLFTLTGENAGDRFGNAVAGYKDKRHAFLVVGAPGAGPNRHGRVYVYRALSAKPAFVIESDETGARLGGMFISVVGDVNGDKVPDIYASDWNNNAKGPTTGRVYVHSGADGRRLYTFTGEAAGDGFGIGTADVGDVNKDGYDDLLIGAWQHSGAASSGGKVYLYSGKDGRLLRAITCRIPGDTFGFDATGIGDVDGDGVVDFLLTSTWSGIKGFQSGRMFVISGKSEKD